MAYMNQEKKAQVSPAIKAVLKKYNIKGSIAVRDHSTLVVNIKSGNIDFIKNYNDLVKERPHYSVAKDYIDVNTSWYQDHFSGDAVNFLEELITAMKSLGWYNRSDYNTDYFDVAYYIDINIGKWNKPYQVEA